MTYHLGIDVGAARTSAAVARAGADDVEPVDLGDGGCGVASVLHLGADGSLDVGEAAERWADDEPDRVVRGFPGRIGDDVPMLLAGEPWAPEELTAWLVRWVVDRVAEREGGTRGGRRRDAPGLVGRRPHRPARRRGGRAGPRRHLPDHGARRRVAAPTTRDDPAERRLGGRLWRGAASRAGGSERHRDVAARLAALAQFTGATRPRQRRLDDSAGRGARAAQPRSGGWGRRRILGPRRASDGSGSHRAVG